MVIAATGVLHHPRLPDIAGLDSFGGAMFHSARWDHAVPLDGSRIGIVGTGSTAVQIVSAVVDRVAHLTLFQRTAQWVMPAANPPFTEEQREEFRRDPARPTGAPRQPSAHLFDGFSGAVVDAESPQMKHDRGRLPGEPRGATWPIPGSASASGPTTGRAASV